MKKTYFKPEMEVVDINLFQPLLAGSANILDVNTEPEIEDPSEILAPPGGNFGLPSIIFQ